MLNPLRPPHPNPTGLKDLPAPTQKFDPIFPNNSILNKPTLTHLFSITILQHLETYQIFIFQYWMQIDFYIC